VRGKDSTLRRLAALAIALIATLALAAGPAEAWTKPSTKVTVMTRNLYLGTDLIPIATQPTEAAFEQAATRGFNNVKATDFRKRATLLAREIKRRRPDLIGLQEVALWRTGPKDGIRSNERTVAFDWLALLRRALRRAGLRYRVGGVQREFDFSAPTSAGFDIRLTMRDAILVKRHPGLRLLRSRGENFKNLLTFPIPALGVTVPVKRGWVYADMKLGERRFRLLDTHLEAYGASFRLAQARELIARGGPARSGRRLILVGDLNSDPNGDPSGRGDPAPYNALTSFGVRDSWRLVHPVSKGYECCLKHIGPDGLPDLRDPPPFPADHRIDHVLIKGRVRALAAHRVGLDPRNRTASGLWPSDHGGVVTTLRLR
jgi:endonuclease/exonuclease/phosphatase family metal-dependent hydrolase